MALRKNIVSRTGDQYLPNIYAATSKNKISEHPWQIWYRIFYNTIDSIKFLKYSNKITKKLAKGVSQGYSTLARPPARGLDHFVFIFLFLCFFILSHPTSFTLQMKEQSTDSAAQLLDANVTNCILLCYAPRALGAHRELWEPVQPYQLVLGLASVKNPRTYHAIHNHKPETVDVARRVQSCTWIHLGCHAVSHPMGFLSQASLSAL